MSFFPCFKTVSDFLMAFRSASPRWTGNAPMEVKNHRAMGFLNSSALAMMAGRLP